MFDVFNGDYRLTIVSSDDRENAAGNGQELALKVEATNAGGGYAADGEIIINYDNADADIQDAGQRTLSDVCRAVGHTGALQDATPLYWKSFAGRIEGGAVVQFYFPDDCSVPQALAA